MLMPKTVLDPVLTVSRNKKVVTHLGILVGETAPILVGFVAKHGMIVVVVVVVYCCRSLLVVFIVSTAHSSLDHARRQCKHQHCIAVAIIKRDDITTVGKVSCKVSCDSKDATIRSCSCG